MNVGQLKKYLELLSDDTQIILQKDSEGNGYAQCDDVLTDCILYTDNTSQQMIYDVNVCASENQLSENDWKHIKESHDVILLLVPTN
jgi:hypothetical protein